MLKIIAGTAKGRQLFSAPRGAFVRPILARIKKSLFDILRNDIVGSDFLDLFAGTGAVGFEALSRGAARCTFVEKDPQNIGLLHKNAEHLRFANQSAIFRLDVLGDLSMLPGPFSIIFIGTPYKDLSKRPLTFASDTLQNIARHRLLNPDGLVVCQHHKKEIPSAPPEFLKFREEKYGDTVLDFFRFA